MMLPREFFWTDYVSLDDFQKEPLFREINETYLNAKAAPFRLNIPEVKLFNELYYLSIRIQLHKLNCLDLPVIISADLPYQHSQELILSMMYPLLSLQKEPYKYIDDLKSMVEFRGGWYYEPFRTIIEESNHNGTYQLTPHPIDAQIVVKNKYKWLNYLDSFNKRDIDQLINYWALKEDKLTILDDIEKSYKEAKERNERLEPSGFQPLEVADKDYFLTLRHIINENNLIKYPFKEKECPSSFSAFVRNKDKVQVVIETLHKYIDGKNKSQLSSLPIRAAIDAKLLLKPTWEVYRKEFNNCTNSRTAYEKYTSTTFDVKCGFRGKEFYESMLEVFNAI